MSIYRHPRPRKTYAGRPPRVLAATIARYCIEFEARRGPLWDYFASRVPAVYDAEGAAMGRERGLRSDGADSLLCVIVALLRSMDIRRGFLGRPPLQEGARWHRRSVRELFGFAFGKPVCGALSIRRMERWLRALSSLKVLTTVQFRVLTPRGFESEAAIRHVTDELFRLAGTFGQLAKERRAAFQAAERDRVRHRVESVRIDHKKSPPAPTVQQQQAAAVAVGARAPPSRAGPEALRALLQSITNRRAPR
jgi:hypothetical protein